MINDEIKIVVRNELIINKIGEKLYKKHGHLPHLYTHISQKMRELAARKVDLAIQSTSDVIHPQKLKVVIKSTQILSSYPEDTNRYGNPSLALKMGHQLKQMGKNIKNQNQLLMETLKKPQGLKFVFTFIFTVIFFFLYCASVCILYCVRFLLLFLLLYFTDLLK